MQVEERVQAGLEAERVAVRRSLESTTRELLKVSKFQGIPQSFIVDREGNLRGVFTGADPKNLKKMEKLVADIVAEGSTL